MKGYLEWPFRPLQARSIEETAVWWSTCYLPNPAEAIFVNQPHWCIVTGPSGCGKSVVLAALERQQTGNFLINYSPVHWPHATHPWVSGGNHLAQIMTSASLILRHHLHNHPEKIAAFSRLQLEFLRWMLEKAGGSRAFLRWAENLPVQIREQLVDIPSHNLYPTTTDPLDVQGQIDELATLVQKLGFRRVMITADLNTQEIQPHLLDLQELFQWLELTHHPHFVLIAAVPTQAMLQGNIIPRARGRVSVIDLQWSTEQVQTIANKHLQCASSRADISLDTFASSELIAALAPTVAREYPLPSPAGWIQLAETLLYTCKVKKVSRLHKNDLNEVEYHFYKRHFPLKLDEPNHGVWRGYHFIQLDDQPLRLLSLLQQCAGFPINLDDSRLFSLVGSKDNFHTVVSRTRKAIEPIPDTPLYLLNKRGVGYWLENYTTS